VVEVMASEGGIEGMEPKDLAERVKMLSPRWFVVRNVQRSPTLGLVQSRTTLSWMRGPMTRPDVRRA